LVHHKTIADYFININSYPPALRELLPTKERESSASGTRTDGETSKEEPTGQTPSHQPKPARAGRVNDNQPTSQPPSRKPPTRQTANAGDDEQRPHPKTFI